MVTKYTLYDPKQVKTYRVGNTKIHGRTGFFKNIPQLLHQYSHLIRKMGKYFSRGFTTYDDDRDLFSYIIQCFITLVYEYDPYSGVDFPGYIIRKLPLRIRYSYVNHAFAHKSHFVLLHSQQQHMNDLLDLIQVHGGQSTYDHLHRLVSTKRIPQINFGYHDLLTEIRKKVPMDLKDKEIFGCFRLGYFNYNSIIRILGRLNHQRITSTRKSHYKNKIKKLRKRLREVIKVYLAN